MSKDPPTLSARAAALLKEEEQLSARVQEVVDEFIDQIRAPGVPRALIAQCEFARYRGRLVEILTHVRERAR
jgi:ribosome maturation factor RimP